MLKKNCKFICEIIKVIILLFFPQLTYYVYLISFYFLNYIENFVYNLNLKNWIKILFLEASIFICFIVFIFLNMVILEVIIKIFYKKLSVKLIKDMLFILSIRINLLKNKLKEKPKLSDFKAYLYIVSFIINIVVTISYLYDTIFNETIFNENIIKYMELGKNQLVIIEIIIFLVGIIIFFIFYYALLIGRIIYLFMKDKKTLLFYIIVNIVLMYIFRNTKLIILYCSAFIIIFYFPFSNERYLKFLYYISGFFHLFSEAIKDYSEIFLKYFFKRLWGIIRFFLTNICLMNFIYFYLGESENAIIVSCCLSLVITILMFIHTKQNNRVKKIRDYILSIFFLLIGFFSLKIFDNKSKTNNISDFFVLSLACLYFFERCNKLIKELKKFIKDNYLIYIYENYTYNESLKLKLSIEEIKNIKDETEIEKQFIFYLKTEDKKMEKVLEYYLESGFKENKEFICYLYLKKSNGKKIETIKKEYDELTKNQEKFYELVFGAI